MPQRPELPHAPAGRGEPRLLVPRQRSASPAALAAATPSPVMKRWQRRYSVAVQLADVVVVIGSTVLGILVGIDDGAAAAHARAFSGTVAAILVILALVATRAWEARVLGSGSEEFRRLAQAFVGADVALALGGLALHIQSVRVWVFAFVPLTALLCVLARFLLRAQLHHERRRDLSMLSVLAVGDDAGVADLVGRTRRDPGFGWRVVGVCTPTGMGPGGGSALDGVPVVGDLDSVVSATLIRGIDVVAVAPAPGWGPLRLQQLAWDLEGSGTTLAVAPGMMEIAGPRLHISPVDGMPLLRVTKPRFGGSARLAKDVGDRLSAALLLLLLVPVFAAAAVVARRRGGPVFHRHDRVGKGGTPFRMITFRSTPGSRVSTLMRKHSIDQLPQLLNVLAGSMSLVGPRPRSASDVAEFGPAATRRLLVKPGITGLWQINGPGELAWEESVRLDLRYVENWSAPLDVAILCRTVGAVARGR